MWPGEGYRAVRSTPGGPSLWKCPLPGALLLEAEELLPKERRCEDSCCSGACFWSALSEAVSWPSHASEDASTAGSSSVPAVRARR